MRAKHMTLDPAGNRYIKYIRNIRTIQVHEPCVLSVSCGGHTKNDLQHGADLPSFSLARLPEYLIGYADRYLFLEMGMQTGCQNIV